MATMLADSGPTLPDEVVQHAVVRGALESPWIWRSLLLITLVVGYLLFRPRAREQSLATKLVVVATMLGLSGMTWLNSYVGYVRTPYDLAVLMQRGSGWAAQFGAALASMTGPEATAPAPGPAAQHGAPAPGPVQDVQVRKIALPDPGNGVPTGMTNVMLPRGYDAPENRTKRYPVVYLVHGYPAGSSDDWFTSGDALATMQELVRGGLVQPMIVVAPDMQAGVATADWECLNVPRGPQLETYLTRTVTAAIDSRFRTIPDRAHRALGGMSGGGFCALNSGLRNLDRYGTLLVSLPYDTPGDATALLSGHPDLLRANTPRDYIPTMRFTAPVAVMLSAGENAQTDMTTARRIKRALEQRGQQVFMRFEPNLNHTWRTARAALPYMLAYANEQFPH
ncbi:enterochelin esterase-like enzyme [Kutzneria viridogrisea]|uniref:Enterochelin esterase-like enzyme n=2 Tax=Kutzneria viridogrisea TaxID=47990 RepID=A0ABR6BS24_9PSEU|nr:enterochelin esterase-like enzyme [Kutzneria viridogrisea]